MFLLDFHRKWTAVVLSKSIESAIQWFQIHHRITFAAIQNPAVYLWGARVSIFPTLVPRLLLLYCEFIAEKSLFLRKRFVVVLVAVFFFFFFFFFAVVALMLFMFVFEAALNPTKIATTKA